MRAHQKREDGFVIVLFALLLMVLLVFAAFAIDLGALYNERRQDQNAADAGALAAANELDSPVADMVAAAKDYAEDTLEVDLPDSGANSWNDCASDPGALTTQATGSNCISYTDREVRVRLPDQVYETVFARFGGSDSFTHAAFAIAGMRPAGLAGVLPYAVTGPSADGGFGCLQTNSNGQASSWCGSTSGNFGFLDFSQYGNSLLNTTESCGSGDTHDRMRDNTAMGVDHDLSRENEVYNFHVVDAPTACQAGTPAPNAANTQTGNWSSDITEGLFFRGTSCVPSNFSDGQPSRLLREDGFLFDGGGQQRQVFCVPGLDDNALWRFIPANYGPNEATPADIPESCKRDQFANSSGGYYATAADNPDLDDGVEAFVESAAGANAPRDVILGLLSRCFVHYMGQSWNGFPVGSLSPEAPTGCSGPCGDPVFAVNSSSSDQPDLYDIQYTPRFAYVPQISGFPSGQSQSRAFIRFRPIFIQRVLIETSGPGSGTIFDPGVTPAPPQNGSYQRVGETSVFVFPETMLPGGLGGEDAPFEIGVNRFVRLIR
jgi:hypothetical protein